MTTSDSCTRTDESVSQRAARALASRVSHSFGVVGNGNVHLVDSLLAHGVPYTAVRHEFAAVSAADGYHRASGRVAVATTTYGAGFTNALTAVAEAVRARTPLVLVSGAAPSSGDRPWDVDQAVMARAVGAIAYTLTTADVARTIASAVDHALTHRTVAVVLVPYDVGAQRALPEAAWEATAPGEVDTPQASEVAIRDVAQLLRSAERPLILAGRGVVEAGARPAVAALASRVGAVTATTALARGLFDDESGALGVAGGFSEHRVFELMKRADMVLAVGASLNDFTTRGGQLLDSVKNVVQVDLGPEPTHRRVDTYLRGDARLVAEALLAVLPADERPRWLVRDEVPPPLLGDAVARDGRLDPRVVTAWLDQALPEDRLVVQDGGHFVQWPLSYLRTPRPESLLMIGLAYQSIGLGLGGAVGAAVAAPDSTTVVCVGDGGCLMALSELETVIRTIEHGVVLVYNDAAYGAEIHQYGDLDPAPMLVDEVDFAATARALGARGVVVRTPGDLVNVADAITGRPDGVVLLDLRISRKVVAPFVDSLSGH